MIKGLLAMTILGLTMLAGSPAANAQGTSCVASLAPPPPTMQVIGTEGARLRVRDQASVNGRVIDELPDGSRVGVISGPIVAGDYHWLCVGYGSVTGWVVNQFLRQDRPVPAFQCTAGPGVCRYTEKLVSSNFGDRRHRVQAQLTGCGGTCGQLFWITDSETNTLLLHLEGAGQSF